MSTRSPIPPFNVAIAGAGPAGCAAAIRACMNGLRVLVCERAAESAEKVCGDGLIDESIRALGELGISVDRLTDAGARPIRSSLHIEYGGGRHTLLHSPDTCFTLRRKALLGLLRERVREVGATVHFQDTLPSDLPTSCVIDATGCRARFASYGAQLPFGMSMLIRANTPIPSDTLYFVHHRANDNGYCWAFPLSEGLWNIGVWQEKEAATLKPSFSRFFETYIEKHFDGIEIVRPLAGSPFGTWPSKATLSPSALKCGDAAGLCDKQSGEGISRALRSGIDAADSILSAF